MEKPARRKRARRLLLLVGALASVRAIRKWRPAPVRVEGESMMPTLPSGALVAVSHLNGTPGLGAIVVVRRPDGSEHLKRIVAVPGDRFVGPVGLTFTLKDDEFAVAGDNRSASTDSRHYGPVQREEIVAIARACYWPPGAWRRLPKGSS